MTDYSDKKEVFDISLIYKKGASKYSESSLGSLTTIVFDGEILPTGSCSPTGLCYSECNFLGFSPNAGGSCFVDSLCNIPCDGVTINQPIYTNFTLGWGYVSFIVDPLNDSVQSVFAPLIAMGALDMVQGDDLDGSSFSPPSSGTLDTVNYEEGYLLVLNPGFENVTFNITGTLVNETEYELNFLTEGLGTNNLNLVPVPPTGDQVGIIESILPIIRNNYYEQIFTPGQTLGRMNNPGFNLSIGRAYGVQVNANFTETYPYRLPPGYSYQVIHLNSPGTYWISTYINSGWGAKEAFQPLIDRGYLELVSNYDGDTLTDDSGTWVDNIGLIEPQKFYEITVNHESYVVFIGPEIPPPWTFDFPAAGEYTFGVPKGIYNYAYTTVWVDENLNFMTELIADDVLVKLKDKQGILLQKSGVNWTGASRTLEEGKAYKVEISGPSSLTLPNGLDCVASNCCPYAPINGFTDLSNGNCYSESTCSTACSMCTSNSDCPLGLLCNTSSGQCVDCLTNSDCLSGQECVNNVCQTIDPCDGQTEIIDSRDGRVYPIIAIGDLCWLGKNLNVGTMSTYQNLEPFMAGSVISHDNIDKYQVRSGNIKKWCPYYNVSECDVYGGLYPWREATDYYDLLQVYSLNNQSPYLMSDDGIQVQGICPDGWHMPSQMEIDQTLSNINPELAGKFLIHDYAISIPLNDVSADWLKVGSPMNFNAFYAGYKEETLFSFIGELLDLWSRDYYVLPDNTRRANVLRINRTASQINIVPEPLAPPASMSFVASNGKSVRCIKDYDTCNSCDSNEECWGDVCVQPCVDEIFLPCMEIEHPEMDRRCIFSSRYLCDGVCDITYKPLINPQSSSYFACFTGGGNFCDGAGHCVECLEDSHCSGSTPVCNLTTNNCTA